MTQQTQQQMQPQPPNDAARLFAVEKDVNGLKDGLASLTASVDKGFRDLASDMKAETKARSTTNWAPISLLATVLIALGTLGIGYLSSNQTRLEAMIGKQEARTDRYVPSDQLDRRFEVLSQRRDDLQKLVDERIARIERDVDGLAKQVVPRGEHDTIRQLQIRDYDLLRNRLDRVEGRFIARTDGLGHAIEKIEDRGVQRADRRIEALEGAVRR